jgi:anti-sigma regulatory factor (Ser/Thr protein kinase)
MARAEFGADLDELRLMEPWLRQVLAPCLDADLLTTVLPGVALAVQEVCVNAIVHGGRSRRGTIDLQVELGTELTVIVDDDGIAFDPTSVVEPDPAHPQEHGYGVMIVRRLTSRFAYERCGDINRTTMSFRLEPTHVHRMEPDD